MNDDEIIGRLRAAGGQPSGPGVDPDPVLAMARAHRARAVAIAGGAAALTVAAAITMTTLQATPDSRPASTPSPVATLVTGLTCPGSVPRYLDGQPLQTLARTEPTGFTSDSALVPRDVPLAAVICRYEFVTQAMVDSPETIRMTADVPLDEVTELDGDLSGIPDVLLEADPGDRGTIACSEPTRRQWHYLLGLRYANATVWVGARTSCSGTSNGLYSTQQSFARHFAESEDVRAWWRPGEG